MAYSELLADRIRRIFADKKTACVEEKKMMAGLTFMVNDKMCVGVVNDELMARVGAIWHEEAITLNGCRTVVLGNKTMKGFVCVGPEAIDADDDLDFWVQKALDYNPLANATRKK